jgi:hypothetical protein
MVMVDEALKSCRFYETDQSIFAPMDLLAGAGMAVECRL